MRKIFFFLILLFVSSQYFIASVNASSSQAYQDYRFQFEQYRQKLTDYRVAYNQYKQFNSLTSQADALEKIKIALAQRNQVSKTYYLFLNEKINENPGVVSADAALYRSLMTNHIGFLDQNTLQTATINTLSDAATISTLYVKNYNSMQSIYRQTIVGVQLGYLQYFVLQFDTAAIHAQSLIAASKGDATPEKQATLDRWLLALSNKHSLFEQKNLTIRNAMAKLTGDVQEQDRQFAAIQTLINKQKQDLIEGASYLGELEQALQYE